MLPTKVLPFSTPTECLLNVKPNYDALQTFGCACWPNLRPYNKRKLSFRSKRCVFFGYSPLHKGVKCLDVATRRVYISRDVVFDEHIFPFAELHLNAGSRLRQEILLLPHSNHGVAHVDDHMSPIVPITNVHQEQQATEENLSENGEEMPFETHVEHAAENVKNAAEHEADPSEHSSGSSDPEGDAPREGVRRQKTISFLSTATPKPSQDLSI